MRSKKTVFLVCTGLGRISRGFEIYIQSLAEKLTLESNEKFQVKVYSGGRLNTPAFHSTRVFNVHRNYGVLTRMFSSSTLFEFEQLSFFFFFLPHILTGKPDVIYLGEYKLYCYLFKARKLLNLNFSLVLYTGGQVSPGLFDPTKDYVHHITDIYYHDLLTQGFPAKRQFVIPHFLDTCFSVDQSAVNRLKQRARKKRILLSVGSLDASTKRMNLIPQITGDHANEIFPILLGEWSNESEAIRQSMIDKFGEDGFIMLKVPRRELGSYYSAADIFMLCSKKESFGLVFLEAMHFNLPVICHDFHEVRYVLQNYGHFVNMDDAALFKQEFTRLLPLLNKKEQYSSFIQQYYTWSALRGKYLHMFEDVVLNHQTVIENPHLKAG